MLKKAILIAFAIIPLCIYAQKLEYNIVAKDKNIGKLTVNKSKKGEYETITARSNAEVDLFIHVSFSYKLTATYKNDVLTYCSVTTYVNGKLHSSTTAEKKADHYLLTEDDHTSKHYSEINCTGANLYFREPAVVKQFFSEFSNTVQPIKKTTKCYEITNPENKQLSEYYYKNGTLEKIVVNHKLLAFSMNRVH